MNLFVTGHKGFETLLFHELRGLLDSQSVRLQKQYGGIKIDAELDAAYRICLHSRLANRVFLELAQFRAADEKMLYDQVYRIDWSEHMRASNSLAVSANLSRSTLDHDHYAALKVKDAVVDRFRDSGGSRPSVARARPDLHLHLHLHQNRARLSIDLSGESLHRRGYRQAHTGAPLREHLAAALLIQAGWRSADDRPRQLLDPMCGSGTFAIEAALIAADCAPGLRREYFGFKGWRGHQPDLWLTCLEAARVQVREAPAPFIFARDYDAAAIGVARDNARRAGVQDWIDFSHQQLVDCSLTTTDETTLIIANPPYGKRIQSEQDLGDLYADLGKCVKRLSPARLALISANPECLHRLGLSRSQRKPVRNGPLDCVFTVYETGTARSEEAAPRVTADTDAESLPLRNRLQKNARHLQRWAQRNRVSCYRLYDADLPEFAFALDRYQSELDPAVEWFHLQEYQAPASIDADKAAHRIEVAKRVVQQVFSVPAERLFCKLRVRQKGARQYQRQDRQGELFQVREGEASVLLNLSDYLDTGLFLDHRTTRERIHAAADGKTMLNLFCYTAVAGVQAGLGGASSVINVDLSPNYLRWAAQNHALNRLEDESRYQFVRADALAFLEDPGAFSVPLAYDLIFLDPPSFSNSSKMQQTLDIQRDHAHLIAASMRLLNADGVLIFSCNRRGFKLADSVEQDFRLDDITRATIPEDFRRNPRIHRCWEIRHREPA